MCSITLMYKHNIVINLLKIDLLELNERVDPILRAIKPCLDLTVTSISCPKQTNFIVPVLPYEHHDLDDI